MPDKIGYLLSIQLSFNELPILSNLAGPLWNIDPVPKIVQVPVPKN